MVSDNEETLSFWEKLFSTHDNLDAENAHEKEVILTNKPKVEPIWVIWSFPIFDEHRIKEKDGQKKEIKDIKDRYGQRDGDQSEPRTEVCIEEIAKPSTDAKRD